MYGFGDDRNVASDTVNVMEEILVEYIIDVVCIVLSIIIKTHSSQRMESYHVLVPMCRRTTEKVKVIYRRSPQSIIQAC